MPRGRGQPTKFTPDRIDLYLRARRLGTPKLASAHIAGWSTSLIMLYLQRGHDARERHEQGERLTHSDQRWVEFLAADEQAEGELKQALLARIQSAAQQPQHWQAAAWILHRRFPDEFGPTRIEISGPGGGPIRVDVRASELLERLRQLSATNGHSNGHAELGDPDVIDVEAEEG